MIITVKMGVNSSSSTATAVQRLMAGAIDGKIIEREIDQILGLGIDVDVVDANGATALSLACKHGHCDIVKHLISKGSSVNKLAIAGSEKVQRTPLFFACVKGGMDVATVLLDSGADINQIDSSGMTALMALYSYKNRVSIEFMVQKGADVSIGDESSLTILHLACRDHRVADIQVLLQLGADPNIRTRTGLTPLHFACEIREPRSYSSDCVHVLITHKANVNAVDCRGFSVIHAACRSARLADVRLLVENGADPNLVAHDGRTPLHCACFRGDMSIVTYLLEQNVSIDAQNQYGWNALHYACTKGSFELSRLLVQNGADFSAINKEGNTPIELMKSLEYRIKLEDITSEILCGLK